jgi:CheY-like chemotaxis protein
VDDNEQLRRAIYRIVATLARRFYAEEVPVLTAPGGEKAIELVGDHDKIHGSDVKYMLITDGDMPGMRGPELVEALDEKLEGRLLVRVIASGNPDYESDANRLRAFFLRKPFGIQEFEPFIRLLFTN